MARLAWDQTGERRYETGVDHGVLYVYDPNRKEYETGVAWNGLTTVTNSPSGAEPNAVYADNIKYLNLISAEEFGATIEAYTYPEEFELCDGSVTNSGISLGQQARRPFGFAYRTRVGNDTQGDQFGEKIHVIYNALATPSESSFNTVNDSPEAITFSWTVSTTPVPFDQEGAYSSLRPVSRMSFDSTKMSREAYETLTNILWGTRDENPRLPEPSELLETLNFTVPSGSNPTNNPGGAPSQPSQPSEPEAETDNAE